MRGKKSIWPDLIHKYVIESFALVSILLYCIAFTATGYKPEYEVGETRAGIET